MKLTNLYSALLLVLLLGFSAISNAQNGSLTINENPEIPKLLELKKEINKSDKKRYKINIYSGSLSGAERAKTNFLESFSGWKTALEYETPNYKIYVGDFRTRLEADRALRRVKKKFPNAFYLKP